MQAVTLPTPPKQYTTTYNNFRGVDFSVDPPLVGKDRSPESVNMISDSGGNPRKRRGWRTERRYNGPINGIYRCDINGEHIIVHAGTEVHDLTEEKVLAYDVTSKKGCGFSAIYKGESRFFLLTGGEYMMFDGTSLKRVRDIAYIPQIRTQSTPDGDGTMLEAVNLLQPRRIEGFVGDGSSKTYRLLFKDVYNVEVKKLDDNGNWNPITGFSVNSEEGTITFTETHPTNVSGAENIRIEYAVENPEYPDFIEKCTVATTFGLNQYDRVFVSGNPDKKAYDWMSASFDPTYFPDNGYSIVGNNDTEIMGYQKLGDYLGIIKEDNEQDTTVYLRSGTLGDEVTYFIKQGVAGIGAISRHSFATLNDEPMFLSRNGVYATTSTQIQYERSAQNRSWWVDKRLSKEPNLQNACACVYGGNYLLAVNNHVYVLDGKRMSSVNGGHSYDCYYWENVPAICWLSYANDLWFGTEDGRVCRFNTDRDSVLAYNDDEDAIFASWATVDDNDGATQLLKTMQKRGGVVTLSPFSRSSVKVYISADGQNDELVREGSSRFFDFGAIDFEDFTFEASDAPQTVYINKKRKKYKRLQIIVVNDKVNEGFGIHEIVKTFVYGNYAKK